MTLREWSRGGRPGYVALWVVAVVFVGLALADVSLPGIDPVMMAVLAAVFAAVTTVYNRAF